jgi:hypothetical protein
MKLALAWSTTLEVLQLREVEADWAIWTEAEEEAIEVVQAEEALIWEVDLPWEVQLNKVAETCEEECNEGVCRREEEDEEASEEIGIDLNESVNHPW